MKIGILEEGKTPPDERVALTPEQCRFMTQKYGCEIQVQKSVVRRITDDKYLNEGLNLVDDVSDCDVLFGVKEVPIDRLINDKTYFFFSHTIKEQPYNRDLLRSILSKNIRLIDYECLVNKDNFRVLGFGRYAGIVGAYNGFRMIGQKTKSFAIKKAHDCIDQEELHEELKKVKTEKLRICLTGRGRVAKGAMEILNELGVQEVSADDYLSKSYDHAVYAVLAVTDYNKRKDGGKGSIQEFFKHPELYESNFMQFATVTDYYIACHYWDAHAPFIYTKEDLASDDFKIQYVSDISCDIDGPVASTIRPSTIEEPFYGIDRHTCIEVDLNEEDSLAVMAVDNLPCELPVDASNDFGKQLLKNVIPALFNGDEDEILKRATIAQDGKLTERFRYLSDYIKGAE